MFELGVCLGCVDESRPILFPGQISQEETEPGSVCPVKWVMAAVLTFTCRYRQGCQSEF